MDSVIHAAQASRYVGVATTMLFVYDSMITMDQEVKFVWTSRWTYVRMSYHFNRIFSAFIIGVSLPVHFGQNLSAQTCRTIFLIYGVGSLILSMNITSVIILRTWVLFDRRRVVLVLVILALTVLGTVSTTFLIFAFQKMRIIPNPVTEIFGGCAVSLPINEFRVPLVGAFVLDTTIVVACLWRTWALTRFGFTSPLIKRIMRDGTIYYFAYAVALGWVLLALAKGVSGHLIALQSVLYSRMILSLRTFERKDQLAATTGIGELGPRIEGPIFLARPRGNSLIELDTTSSFSYAPP